MSALADYYRAVELGLGACFRESGPAPHLAETKEKTVTGVIRGVVFGSDQGLVGQFNDMVADFAVKTLAVLPGKLQVWAAGERVPAQHKNAFDRRRPPFRLRVGNSRKRLLNGGAETRPSGGNHVPWNWTELPPWRIGVTLVWS